ncbi:MAG: hypothetical protein A4E63_02044 [Syntrophorhabdus sp. PtaU1.Bin050]|jgi:hypothetical protein|nr:MAG: hypothetical protein A4E63_02044 [Syntrophorhabdus sp. PtaU1.Bin050]
MADKWQSYEDVATYLLNQCAQEFGLSKVEGKQTVPGLRSNTEWEIDAKGANEGSEGFVIIECRRYTTSRQNQERIASLAYRILDTGAQGGIIVSPLGLQEGAEKVARAERIVNVQLSPDSTPHEFAMQFVNKIFLGFEEQISLHDEFSVEVTRACSECGERFSVKENERVCPKCSEEE